VTSDVWRRRSPLVFLFVTVFVDMIGYGIVVPLLPFYAGPYASGAALVGLLGSLYAAMQFASGPFLGGLSDRQGPHSPTCCSASPRRSPHSSSPSSWQAP
jgi:MFS family permease